MNVSLWRKRDLTGITAGDLIPRRPTGKTGSVIGGDSAMRNSAVWACVRLRADLVSSFPIDTFRLVDGRQVEMTKPAVLVTPGGPRCRAKEWVYSTQVDLDRYGNTFGLITARDGFGLPARIDLFNAADVTVVVKNGAIAGYRVGRETYDPADVWHEKQYTVAGLPVGLSPVAYAAWSLSQYRSIQQFALDWFNNGTMPSATLKNTQKVVPPKQAAEIKDVYRASVERGDIFVHGTDWEFTMLSSQAATSQWLEGENATLLDVCRFFGCPGDIVDVVVAGQAITYANITQRNLQFLTLNLGPAVSRREEAWTYGLVPAARFVKLNTSALLRLDPATQSEMLGQQLKDRIRTPTEVRALYDLPPFTAGQLAEFIEIYGAPVVKPPTTKELAAPAPQFNLRVDGPTITMPETRVLNEYRMPPAQIGAAPVVNVNVEPAETIIRLQHDDD